jgi:hypothetical protein
MHTEVIGITRMCCIDESCIFSLERYYLEGYHSKAILNIKEKQENNVCKSTRSNALDALTQQGKKHECDCDPCVQTKK